MVRRGVLGMLGMLGAMVAAFAAAPAHAQTPMAQPLWVEAGTGWTYASAVIDGKPVVGGRGIGMIDEQSLANGGYRWINKWRGWKGAEGENPPHDDDTAYVLETGDLNDDGKAEVIGGGDHGLFAIDAATGETIWHHADADHGSFNGASQAAVADFDGDGAVDVAYADYFDHGVSVVSGLTGARTAVYAREGGVADLEAADLNLDGVSDLVIVGGESAFEVEAVTFATGDALALWRQKFLPVIDNVFLGIAGGDPVSIAIAEFTPSAGPEVFVGGADAVMVFQGPTGTPLGSGSVPRGTYANDLQPMQLDPDPEFEVVASDELVHHNAPEGHLLAFDGSAAPLWELEMPGPVWDVESVQADADADPEVAVAGGWPIPGGRESLNGFVDAYDVTALGATQVWRRELPQSVGSITVADVLGAPSILASQYATAGEGGGLFALAPDGSVRWEHRTGGRREDVAVDDLDGDGRLEVLEASSDSHLAVHAADGRTLWRARVPGVGGPYAWSLATGQLSADPGREVVTGTWQFGSGPKGTLHAFARGGKALWAAELFAPPGEEECVNEVIPGPVDDIEVRDLDGDGADDVVAAGPGLASQETCGPIARFDRDGKAVWRTALRLGTRTSLEVMELNDDDVLDVLAVRRSENIRDGIIWGLDGRDGEVLWKHVQPSSTTWLSAQDGLIAAGDLDGTITSLRRDGTVVWNVKVGDGPEPFWGSWEGEWSVDANGDGARDLLVGHWDAATRMISGADGSVIWSTPTGGPWSFEVATIRGGKRPVVAAGLFGMRDGYPGAVDLLDAQTGELLATHPARNFILDVAAGDIDDDGAEEAIAGAGYQLVVLTTGQPPANPKRPPPPPPDNDDGFDAPPADSGAPPTESKAQALQLVAGPVRRPAPRVVARLRGRTLRVRLLLPTGTPRSACRGRITAGSRKARVRRDCRVRMRVPAGPRAFRVRFAGNPQLAPASVRVRRR